MVNGKVWGSKDILFARFLYRQDVRELKLATFWIADPVQVTSVEFSDWGEGIANSEMAEECAFALMSRSPRGDEWGRAWCDTGNELLGYAGLLALSRIPHPDFSSLVPVLRRLVVTYPESNLVAQGVVALLAAIMTNPAVQRRDIEIFLSSLGPGKTARYIGEEMTWRLEY